LSVPESISIDLKRAAIALAEEWDYARAAEQLNITSAELRKQVSALETLLCLRIFKPRQKRVELTAEGRFLIKVFRDAVSFYEGKEKERRTGPDR
jgi:DNA-binding transcriptional LysR family regulator